MGPINELRNLDDECKEVIDNIMEWMVNNTESRLVEEAEDMLDGLEEMTASKEMSMTEEVLLKATAIITGIVGQGTWTWAKYQHSRRRERQPSHSRWMEIKQEECGEERA